MYIRGFLRCYLSRDVSNMELNVVFQNRTKANKNVMTPRTPHGPLENLHTRERRTFQRKT